ncbi:tetratricopeptide repeat protein [Sutterella sp.]|uniref:tetratricopeptide repeat protein n=1 Tax=Sutterella sp. TaxID=1981025 RepID=UPI0026E0AF64|nr:SEL1-like repeat protein [Sutterella sp.]MDO5533005.1 sel1 repeat family protein [Sutterella sp.]
MPKRPDERFTIPRPEAFTLPVLDLLGGVARPRVLTGAEAIAELGRIEEKARAGDPAAQAELARRLLTEDPDARKNRRALLLLKKSAASGNPEGLHLLALVHLRGQGLKQNLPEGVRLLETAAYKGNRDAARDLARAAAEGIGMAPDPGKALYWLRIAGAQGDSPSSLAAGRACRDSSGTQKNDREAEKWLERAAQGGVAEAQYELAELKRRSPEVRDPAASRRWMREAAFSGIVDAQFRTGVASWSGAGGSVDQREAVRWLCRAAEGGSAKAASMLAGFFMTGNGLPLSPVRAWALFLLADALGDTGAAAMASMLERQIPQPELDAARAWLEAENAHAFLETVIPRSER